VIGDLLMTFDIDPPREEINIYRTPRESIHEVPADVSPGQDLGALPLPAATATAEAADDERYEIRPAGFEGFLDGIRASAPARR
jgi:hypothetical protein